MPVAHRQEIPLQVRAVDALFWEVDPHVLDGLHEVFEEDDQRESFREGDEEWRAVFRFHLLRQVVHQIIDPKNHYPDPVVLACYDLL
jgi:hypothetical protein